MSEIQATPAATLPAFFQGRFPTAGIAIGVDERFKGECAEAAAQASQAVLRTALDRFASEGGRRQLDALLLRLDKLETEIWKCETLAASYERDAKEAVDQFKTVADIIALQETAERYRKTLPMLQRQREVLNRQVTEERQRVQRAIENALMNAANQHASEFGEKARQALLALEKKIAAEFAEAYRLGRMSQATDGVLSAELAKAFVEGGSLDTAVTVAAEANYQHRMTQMMSAAASKTL